MSTSEAAAFLHFCQSVTPPVHALLPDEEWKVFKIYEYANVSNLCVGVLKLLYREEADESKLKRQRLHRVEGPGWSSHNLAVEMSRMEKKCEYAGLSPFSVPARSGTWTAFPGIQGMTLIFNFDWSGDETQSVRKHGRATPLTRHNPFHTLAVEHGVVSWDLAGEDYRQRVIFMREITRDQLAVADAADMSEKSWVAVD